MIKWELMEGGARPAISTRGAGVRTHTWAEFYPVHSELLLRFMKNWMILSKL